VNYDVVIAGGSVAGLLCAREIASKGFSVLVIEEDYEIGTPEHCGGLVSLSGLEELGVIPFKKTFDHMIELAEITSPNGNSFKKTKSN
jgi:flavin-dependent dehydrogenase